MCDGAVRLVRAANYTNAGTVEFIVDRSGRYYFIEMNARIQVEHPVTELVTGIDLIKAQILVAAGEKLPFGQDDIRQTGAAIECRINAEDPVDDFVPTPGRIRSYLPPGGPGVRVDSGVYDSYTIPPFYDPMIAKLIVWGRDRSEAIGRMRRALGEYAVLGVKTNIPFHLAVMGNDRFLRGELGTNFIERETALAAETARIAGEMHNLGERLGVGHDKRKIAAIAAVTAVLQS